MKSKDEYIAAIVELLNICQDISLLDLILKLLQRAKEYRKENTP